MVSENSTEQTLQHYTNPQMIQETVLSRLSEQVLGGEPVTEGNNVYTFTLECNAQCTADFANLVSKKCDSFYPSRAQSFDDLYHWMSDWDYEGIYAYPAQTTVELILDRKFIIDNAKEVEGTRYKQIILPSFSKFMIGTYQFGIHYPISIQVKNAYKYNIDGSQSSVIDYDNCTITTQWITDPENPLCQLDTNILEHRTYTKDGVDLLCIAIPLYQFVMTRNQSDVISNTGYFKTYTFDNKFYVCRIYHLIDDVWTEIGQTYSDIVYDPYNITAQVKVYNDTNKFSIEIPQVYFTKGLVGSKIRVDVYTTFGSLDLDISEYSQEQFTASFLLDDNTDNSEYSGMLKYINYCQVSPLSTRIISGRDSLTFEELKRRVISDTTNKVLITANKITNYLQDNGLTAKLYVDNLTDRYFLAEKELTDSNSKVISAGMAITRFDGNDTAHIYNEDTKKYEIKNHDTFVYVDDNTTVVLPSTWYYYNVNTNYAKPMTTEWKTTFEALSERDKVDVLNNGQYTYSPFLLRISNNSNMPSSQLFNLTEPKITNTSFYAENPVTNSQISIYTAELTYVERGTKYWNHNEQAFVEHGGGYWLDLTLYLTDDLAGISINDDNTQKPDKIKVTLRLVLNNGTELFLLGETKYDDNDKPVTYNNFPVMRFSIDTSYVINIDNQIQLTSFSLSGSSDTSNIMSNLIADYNVLFFVREDLISSSAQRDNSALPISLTSLPEVLQTNYVWLAWQDLTISLGEAVDSLLCDTTISVDNIKYVTYPTSTFATYSSSQYYRFKSSDIGTTGIVDYYLKTKDLVYQNNKYYYIREGEGTTENPYVYSLDPEAVAGRNIEKIVYNAYVKVNENTFTTNKVYNAIYIGKDESLGDIHIVKELVNNTIGDSVVANMYYELKNNEYVLTDDTVFKESKTYYVNVYSDTTTSYYIRAVIIGKTIIDNYYRLNESLQITEDLVGIYRYPLIQVSDKDEVIVSSNDGIYYPIRAEFFNSSTSQGRYALQANYHNQSNQFDVYVKVTEREAKTEDITNGLYCIDLGHKRLLTTDDVPETEGYGETKYIIEELANELSQYKIQNGTQFIYDLITNNNYFVDSYEDLLTEIVIKAVLPKKVLSGTSNINEQVLNENYINSLYHFFGITIYTNENKDTVQLSKDNILTYVSSSENKSYTIKYESDSKDKLSDYYHALKVSGAGINTNDNDPNGEYFLDINTKYTGDIKDRVWYKYVISDRTEEGWTETKELKIFFNKTDKHWYIVRCSDNKIYYRLDPPKDTSGEAMPIVYSEPFDTVNATWTPVFGKLPSPTVTRTEESSIMYEEDMKISYPFVGVKKRDDNFTSPENDLLSEEKQIDGAIYRVNNNVDLKSILNIQFNKKATEKEIAVKGTVTYYYIKHMFEDIKTKTKQEVIDIWGISETDYNNLVIVLLPYHNVFNIKIEDGQYPLTYLNEYINTLTILTPKLEEIKTTELIKYQQITNTQKIILVNNVYDIRKLTDGTLFYWSGGDSTDFVAYLNNNPAIIVDLVIDSATEKLGLLGYRNESSATTIATSLVTGPSKTACINALIAQQSYSGFIGTYYDKGNLAYYQLLSEFDNKFIIDINAEVESERLKCTWSNIDHWLWELNDYPMYNATNAKIITTFDWGLVKQMSTIINQKAGDIATGDGVIKAYLVDAEGNPVKDKSGTLRNTIFDVHMVQLDVNLLYSQEAAHANYQEDMRNEITSYFDIIRTTRNRLIEGTDLFFAPKTTTGYGLFSTPSGDVVNIDLNLTLGFRLYVGSYVTSNPKTKENIKQNIIEIIDTYISNNNGVVSCAEIASKILETIGDTVVHIDILGINGDTTLQTIRAVNDTSIPHLGYRLYVEDDNTINVERSLNLEYTFTSV